MKPRFFHDCPHCLLVGKTEGADLYAHADIVKQARGMVELVARFSGHPEDYVARTVCLDDAPPENQELREALALYSASR
jgi:hypothetical protein